MHYSRIPIDVTEVDIDKGTKRQSSKCVVALAVARAVKEANRIDVDMQTVRFSVGEQRYVYLTPWRVQDYIVGFDAGDEIEPFRFQLRDPQITQRTGSPQEAELDLEGKPKRRRARIATVGKGTRVRVGGRVPPQSKTGYRTHTRIYGRRVMRVNQARSEEQQAAPA